MAQVQFEVIGVAGDLRYGQLLDERPLVVYVPFSIKIFGRVEQMVYEIRAAGDPLRYEALVRQTVRDVSARIPVTRVATQASLIDSQIATSILLTRLSVAFALLALTIAIVGVYGGVAYDVSRRTREIGVRMAFGARQGQIVGLVLRRVVMLAVAGIAIGVPAALVTSTLATAYLYGVTPRDTGTLGAAAAVLLGTALAAGYLTARAAARISPTTALRRE